MKLNYKDLIENQKVDINELPARTQRSIKSYEAITPNPEDEDVTTRIEDLNDIIVADVVNYLAENSPEFKEKPVEEKKTLLGRMAKTYLLKD